LKCSKITAQSPVAVTVFEYRMF